MSPSSSLVETAALHGNQHSAQRDLNLCNQAKGTVRALPERAGGTRVESMGSASTGFFAEASILHSNT